MTRQPLVSVVIPAYNAERFLARTLASALQQTCQAIEVIVVDDGSKDETRRIAEAIARTDFRVRVISVENGGVASARNIGIQEARAEFIAFLDSDDLWHPSKLERQIGAMSTRDGIAAAGVFSLMRVIDPADQVIGTGCVFTASGYIYTRHLYARPVGNGSSLLVRRQVARDLGGFDPQCEACEDLEFELRIAAKYPLHVIQMFLVAYRVYPGSSSSNGPKMARSLIKLIGRELEAHPELPAWARRDIWASTLEYAASVLADEGHWPLFVRRCAELLRVDPGRTLHLVARMMGRRILRRLPLPASAESYRPRLPCFQELSPEDGIIVVDTVSRRRDTNAMSRLGHIDEAMGREHSDT